MLNYHVYVFGYCIIGYYIFYVANLAELTAFVRRNENALPNDNEHTM